MIFMLGGTDMIISRLQIKGLHGTYDYDVAFNDDLTFIFGENGCGKTTILNIVSSIVTGRIFNLFSYRFDEITLFYRKGKRRKEERIEISNRGNSCEIRIDSPGIHETIEDIQRIREVYDRDDEYTLERNMYAHLDAPRFLRETFDYIYLPLSRFSQDGNSPVDGVITRRRNVVRYSEKDLINKNYLNDSLRYVEDIVRNGFMRISTAENSINVRFRRELLASSLSVTTDYDLGKLIENVGDENTLASIEKNRQEYIRILRAIGEWNSDMNSQVDNFFEKYKEAYEKMRSGEEQGRRFFTIDFLLMNMEFNRIKQIAAQAQKVEREKEEIRTPINAFLSTVNNFFGISEDKKHIDINDDGRIVVTADSPKRNVSLYHLSSGEKQIIIIFACLIFGLPAGKGGIYIIDEPEASLHLAWQKMFVESIREVNSSIQLIFATHAPEIIGRNSACSVKLRKKVNPKRLEKAGLFDE